VLLKEAPVEQGLSPDPVLGTQEMNLKIKVTAIFVAASVAGVLPESQAQLRTWINPGNGNWTDAGSWSPNGTPGAGDTALVGLAAGTENVNVIVDTVQTVNGFSLLNGASLFVNSGGQLTANNINVSGMFGSNPAELLVQAGVGTRLITNNLTVADGARFTVNNGSEIIVNETFAVQAGSSLHGRGVIEFLGNSGVAFRNDGVIDSSGGFGGLVLNQGGDALLDLDGFSGNGTLVVDSGNGFFGQDQITVNGTQLADSFSGTIHMSTASILDMNLSNGWTADVNSLLTIQSSTSNSEGFAKIQGGPATYAGEFHFLSSQEPFDDMVFLQSESTIQDTASFDLGLNTSLIFQNETTINGGTFSTASPGLFDGIISFAGDTNWDGDVVINGLARQQADATVTGATTINADRFDINGSHANTWNINHALTINANQIQGAASNIVNATLNIGSGIFPRLTINLDEPGESWALTGEMNLSNNLPFHVTKVAGSRMRLGGDLNISGAGVRISADVELTGTSTTHFASSASSLVLQGQSVVQEGAIFGGGASLINGSGGSLRLADGASLDETGMVNQGLLEIGDSTGVADVAWIEMAADATWLVEIGGYLPGEHTDVLLVSDGLAQLDGILEVELIDLDGQLFAPQVGDEFTILLALGGILGEFDYAPTSTTVDAIYQWEVLYNPHDVTLRLASIAAVPEPATSLTFLGLIVCLWRRRD